MSKAKKIVLLPLWASLASGFLAGCSPAPEMSGIAAERLRAVHRYDIAQAAASNGKVVVAGTQDGAVLISDDQGKSWRRTALGNSSLVDITTCGERGFVAIDHYHKLWSADAAGGNWQAVPLELPRTPLAVTCDALGGWWVAGTNAVIAGSSDQGKTWKTTELGEDTQITSLQFLGNKKAVALGEFGLTVFSEDGGATWKKGAKIPGDFYPYAALFRNDSEGWVSGIAGQMLHTTDGGKSWQKQANTAHASLYRLFLHDGAPVGVGSGGVIARLDGNTWRVLPYTDPVPVFLGASTSLPGQSAVVIGGPGGLLRAVSTVAKQ
ncbi:MAG: glycosyl hydrolase [Proteobacteria bacterium]|nr:glycosyl hydrolase [Pseudomonadota bacterium]